jgi:hypothetical protein
MVPQSGLQLALGEDLDDRCSDFEASGWRVFVLPHGISDRASFFGGVRTACPLDPPLIGDRVWDALSDSLWSGLDAVDDGKIAIIWPDSTLMARLAPEEFSIAQDILADITESLADNKATVGHPKQVAVLLL